MSGGAVELFDEDQSISFFIFKHCCRLLINQSMPEPGAEIYTFLDDQYRA